MIPALPNSREQKINWPTAERPGRGTQLLEEPKARQVWVSTHRISAINLGGERWISMLTMAMQSELERSLVMRLESFTGEQSSLSF